MSVQTPGVSKPATARVVGSALGILSKITCPHCWHQMAPADVLWVSQHQELLGDPVVGPEAAKRFLPSRFSAQGQAVDARGQVCQLLACPKCHLHLPRVLVHHEPLFLSIIGGPSSGKTWLLTSMTWQLRRTLSNRFHLLFNDADPLANLMLNENEGKLFLSDTPDIPVNLFKTEEKGAGFYDEIMLAGQPMQLPKPFIFTMTPSPGHRLYDQKNSTRVVCLYDNAGESFQPGHDGALNPTTKHLAKSKVLYFLYDPTQDPRFRQHCREFSTDPQLTAKPKLSLQTGSSSISQHTLLTEAGQRIRRYAGITSQARISTPLVVIVSKSDVWGPMLPDEDLTSEPYLPGEFPDKPHQVDMDRVERVSNAVRKMLLEWSPEVVAAAEGLSAAVIYMPVSALGSCPEPLADNPNMYGAKPANIKPRWVTVPITYAFARWSATLVSGARQEPKPNSAQ